MSDKLNILNLMKNAKKMQALMEQKQAELKEMTVTGESGGGAVQLTMNCKHEALSIKIDPDIEKESLEIKEELIVAAINDALQKADKMAQTKMNESLNQTGLGDIFGGNP